MFREIQPIGRQDFEMGMIGRSTIRFENNVYRVAMNGVVEMLQNGAVVVDVVDFEDPALFRDMDAAFISIKPNESTPIQGWFGDRTFIESVTAGSGIWVGVSPKGELVKYEFDSEKNDQGLICYGAGWIGSWIAGRHGLGILEICMPRFVKDTWTREAKLGDEKVGDTMIPITFQALYSNLMGLTGR